jgi:hypothetical protein
MKKSIIENLLRENHNSFQGYILNLPEADFLKSKDNKWTAGQQLEHIYLSVKPVRLIFGLPRFILKLLWGTANRNSRSYDDLVKKYLQKLENGGRATGRFVPKAVSTERGKQLGLALQLEVQKLCKLADKCSEEELEEYVIPHPLLGKLTLREMLYFTIYHVQHHEEIAKKNLE